jgi:hypothetical protein
MYQPQARPIWPAVEPEACSVSILPFSAVSSLDSGLMDADGHG